MLTKYFWLGENGVLVRSVRTFAQTAIAAIGLGTTNLFTADLENVLALSGSAAILSVLMSLDRNVPTSAPVAVAQAPVVVHPPAADPPATQQLQAGYSGDVR